MSTKEPNSDNLTDELPVSPLEPETTEDDKKRCADLSNCDTRNATTIDWQNAGLEKENWKYPSNWRYTNKRDTYRYYDRLNGGLQNGKRWQNKRYETYRLNVYLMEAVADRVGLIKSLRNKAIGIFTGLNLSEFGRKREWVALAVCGYVLFKDGRRKCHPNNRGESRDETYREACAAYRCSDKEVNTLFYKVEKEIKKGLEDRVRKYGPIESRSEVVDPFGENQTAKGFSSGW